MASNAVAYDLVKPANAAGGMAPRAPRVLYGIGTPDGTIEPLKSAEKGSIFVSTDQTNAAVWVKVAANSATADWALGGATKCWLGEELNLDAGAATKVHSIFYFPRAIEVLSCGLFFTEATDTSGAADATIQFGTTAEGTEVTAATAISAGKAIGSTQAVTLVEGTCAAGFIDVMLVAIAATEAGKFKPYINYLQY